MADKKQTKVYDHKYKWMPTTRSISATQKRNGLIPACADVTRYAMEAKQCIAKRHGQLWCPWTSKTSLGLHSDSSFKIWGVPVVDTLFNALFHALAHPIEEPLEATGIRARLRTRLFNPLQSSIDLCFNGPDVLPN